MNKENEANFAAALGLAAGFLVGFLAGFLVGAFLLLEGAGAFFAGFLDFDAAAVRVLLNDLE